ncbi:MAG: MotA/TolQ/ExbB proton channel family protein [Bacteroidales bacterium]|jgi:biopolymer transport protein ExbB|nr:MotA/TolQ/ExbB proton channel family protein [Bacteroidales bacterium]
MKKIIVLFSFVAFFCFTATQSFAQDQTEAAATEQTATETEAEPAAEAEETALPTEEVTAELSEDATESQPFHQVLKQKFIEGGAGWMAPILIVLILGLALVIERIIYLNMATTNTQRLLENLEKTLNEKGVDAAKELCRSTRGPVASIFYQGLDRIDEGLDIMEKSIVSYGGVAMARLEKNLSWVGYVIAIAPMLGFLGTVVGMVFAFDDIEKAGDISPTIVAGGMKVALLTTVFGLIVAIIIQTFYNYLASKIESLVNDMEDCSISFMDIMVKYIRKQK